MPQTTLVWLRHDLRLADHAALHAACAARSRRARVCLVAGRGRAVGARRRAPLVAPRPPPGPRRRPARQGQPPHPPHRPDAGRAPRRAPRNRRRRRVLEPALRSHPRAPGRRGGRGARSGRRRGQAFCRRAAARSGRRPHRLRDAVPRVHAVLENRPRLAGGGRAAGRTPDGRGQGARLLAGLRAARPTRPLTDSAGRRGLGRPDGRALGPERSGRARPTQPVYRRIAARLSPGARRAGPARHVRAVAVPPPRRHQPAPGVAPDERVGAERRDARGRRQIPERDRLARVRLPRPHPPPRHAHRAAQAEVRRARLARRRRGVPALEARPDRLTRSSTRRCGSCGRWAGCTTACAWSRRRF